MGYSATGYHSGDAGMATIAAASIGASIIVGVVGYNAMQAKNLDDMPQDQKIANFDPTYLNNVDGIGFQLHGATKGWGNELVEASTTASYGKGDRFEPTAQSFDDKALKITSVKFLDAKTAQPIGHETANGYWSATTEEVEAASGIRISACTEKDGAPGITYTESVYKLQSFDQDGTFELVREASPQTPNRARDFSATSIEFC